MLPPRTILAAVDFSVSSEAALVRAATLAARLDASLHLVCAVATPWEGSTSDATLRARLERYVTSALGFPMRGFPVGGLGPTLAVVYGPTVPAAIVRYAEKIDADLLVVGTRGRSGADRFLVGSVAQACVTSATCPVLTVPQGAEAHEPSRDAPVLVAVDFSGLSRAALSLGRNLAALHRAEVEMVHVVREAGPFAGLGRNALDLGTVDGERAETVRQRLVRFAEGSTGEQVHVALGSPSRMIAAVAQARGAGVVVMGAHGRSGVAHAILGSTASATLQRASCAVLTVRHAGGRTSPSRRSTRQPAVVA